MSDSQKYTTNRLVIDAPQRKPETQAQPPRVPGTCPYGCGGTGVTSTGNELTVKECLCSYVKRLAAHLGPEIASAPALQGHCPLFWPPKVDLTSANLILRANWADLLPHLRWTLSAKGPMFRFRIITDEQIRLGYVASGDKYDGETVEPLDHLVRKDDYSLVVIKLGYVGYKNAALPGALLTALRLREVAGYGTWIIETPKRPLEKGNLAWSEEVAEYIDEHYARGRIEAGQ